MSPRASSNPLGLIERLRERKSLKKALKAECTEPVKTSRGDEDCFLCLKGVPEHDYVIFNEDIVKEQGKKRCDCTIIHVRTEGGQAVISLVLLEIKPNLAESLKEARGQLKDTHEAAREIFKGLLKQVRKSFANARLGTLFAIMCPPVRAKELNAVRNKLRLRVDGCEYPIIYLECGEHLVNDLLNQYVPLTPPPSSSST